MSDLSKEYDLQYLTDIKDTAVSLVTAGPVPQRLVRDIRTEAHLTGVRFMRRASPSMRAKERALMKMSDVKLHFGSGPRILPEWINIDGWNFPGIDFRTDLRQSLPLRDRSCRLIFTEHVFEHIDADFRQRVLREFFRVLQPGGTLRIIVPDCQKFVEAYARDDAAWFRDGLGWPDAGAKGLTKVFTMHTHRVIDDWDSLSAALRQAGFTHVERSSFNASAIPELRVDSEAPSRALCSLYVEARP